ncbi:uncharacterized protein LOC113168726, partial [Anabas testudineus]|uniref:uncharacterized protein LOC113168726 n=1 Tax=Anabas testudineus TaxID=64144 RepID=UPI00143DD569
MVPAVIVSLHALGVEVYDGEESVHLPCRVNVSDSEQSTVVWSREELKYATIHIRQWSGDELDEQNQRYVNRTSMRTDALQTGDLGLTLTKPTVTDSDNYTCTVRRIGQKLGQKEVQLLVRERPPIWPKVLAGVLVPLLLMSVVGSFIIYSRYKDRVCLVVVDSGVESVLLPCKATVHLPDNVMVEWRNMNWMVHVHENGSCEPEDQDNYYRDRTEMKKDMINSRDLSLTLKCPTDKDRGTYTCIVYSGDGNILMKKDVELRIRVPLVKVDSGVESVLLPCKTTVPLPEDIRVEWRDSEKYNVCVYQNGSEETGEQDG